MTKYTDQIFPDIETIKLKKHKPAIEHIQPYAHVIFDSNALSLSMAIKAKY